MPDAALGCSHLRSRRASAAPRDWLAPDHASSCGVGRVALRPRRSCRFGRPSPDPSRFRTRSHQGRLSCRPTAHLLLDGDAVVPPRREIGRFHAGAWTSDARDPDNVSDPATGGARSRRRPLGRGTDSDSFCKAAATQPNEAYGSLEWPTSRPQGERPDQTVGSRRICLVQETTPPNTEANRQAVRVSMVFLRMVVQIGRAHV